MDTTAIAVTKPSGSRSLALPDADAEAIAISGWQIVRELLPANMESDQAFLAKVEFLKEVVYEVGPERFIDAVKQAIRISQYRSEVTIKRIRECAGLDVSAPQSPSVLAWQLVTQVVKSHVKKDAEGRTVLVSAIRMTGGNQAQMVPVPEIPEAVSHAVRTMGGWGNLAEAYPVFWGQKFVQFREVYRP